MGYDFHITRARFWAENTDCQISSDEWLECVEKDPELMLAGENGPYFVLWSSPSGAEFWLDWSDGNVYTKNPDSALINKMVAVARELRASLQGDDGEIYRSSQDPPTKLQPSALGRVRRWLHALRLTPRFEEIDLPFKVGDRVMDVFGKETTVIEIDPKANHGILGRVKVRYGDGREATFSLASSGLRPIVRDEPD